MLAWVWLIRSGQRLHILPSQRQRCVPWSGYEVLMALILVFVIWPSFFQVVFTGTGFFRSLDDRTVYPVYLGVLGAVPEAGFPGNLPWLALCQSNEVGETVRATDEQRHGLWLGAFILPVNAISIPVLLRATGGTRLYQLGLTTSR